MIRNESNVAAQDYLAASPRLFSKGKIERRIDEGFRFHLEMRTRENVDAGVVREMARGKRGASPAITFQRNGQSEKRCFGSEG